MTLLWSHISPPVCNKFLTKSATAAHIVLKILLKKAGIMLETYNLFFKKRLLKLPCSLELQADGGREHKKYSSPDHKAYRQYIQAYSETENTKT